MNRPVKVRKWIPFEYTGEFPDKKIVEGTGCFTDFIYNGHLHTWGAALAETSEQISNYTVGIVEMNDGTVEEVSPTNIKFIL